MAYGVDNLPEPNENIKDDVYYEKEDDLLVRRYFNRKDESEYTEMNKDEC